MPYRPELLAPAGDFEKLKFALHYGADAVYLSGKNYGLRAFAGNFTDEEIKKAVEYTHARSKKIYVTVNMYPHNTDLIDLDRYLVYLQEIKVDAIIVADPGVYQIAREVVPDLNIHISTQATIVNWAGIKFWENLGGVERVVLARELTLEEIVEIKNKTKIELEIFVHGAMCMSYSGRCLISNYMVGRDSNRGSCAQPCRWNYALVEERRPGVYYPIEEDSNGSYIFNSNDMCLLKELPLLMECGIDSLKIEGRMKSIFYVATITRAYRKILDSLERKEVIDWEYWYKELDKISHRAYSTGFLLNNQKNTSQIHKESAGYFQPYEFIGVVYGYNKETQIAVIEQRNKFSVGDTVEFFGSNYKEHQLIITEIYNMDGERIESANHAQEKVLLKVPFEIFTMDLIRKRN